MRGAVCGGQQLNTPIHLTLTLTLTLTPTSYILQTSVILQPKLDPPFPHVLHIEPDCPVGPGQGLLDRHSPHEGVKHPDVTPGQEHFRRLAQFVLHANSHEREFEAPHICEGPWDVRPVEPGHVLVPVPGGNRLPEEIAQCVGLDQRLVGVLVHGGNSLVGGGGAQHSGTGNSVRNHQNYVVQIRHKSATLLCFQYAQEESLSGDINVRNRVLKPYWVLKPQIGLQTPNYLSRQHQDSNYALLFYRLQS
jgi:hypothetical protein